MEKVAENLVQHGLNLVRDAKVAHGEVLVARDRARLAEEASRLRREFAEITEARLRAGDLSELETDIARSQARMAEERARRAAFDTAAAEDRLRFLLGMSMDETSFSVVPSAAEPGDPGSFKEMLDDAFASRPDLRAAELAMQAACERAGWERSKILNLSAILDINGEGKEGFEAGPGMLVELPIFNTNLGGRARAEAEMEQAALNYVAVQHRIASEVRQAGTQLRQASEAFRLWRESILPPLEDAVRKSESAYAAGDVSYLAVIEAALQLVKGRIVAVTAAADLRRARAELNRSIGRNRVGEQQKSNP